MKATTIVLERGAHGPDNGVCLLEAAARQAREKHDHPACVSPVIAAYGRVLNDSLNDEDRQLLVPFIPQLIGTSKVSIATERRRAFLAVDWSIRRMMPIWLEAFGWKDDAEKLRKLDPITDDSSADLAALAARADARNNLRDTAIELLAAMIAITDPPEGRAA